MKTRRLLVCALALPLAGLRSSGRETRAWTSVLKKQKGEVLAALSTLEQDIVDQK